ncbi:MAG: Spy/CpxP family protein refolding chaperone [Pseudorhodoferax sp.]
MKSWIKRSLAGLFGAAIVAGSLSACGHRMHGDGWGASTERMAERRAHVVERVARKLELDAAQKAKLDALATRLAEQRRTLMGEGDPREQVRALVAGDRFDRAAAQALVTQKTAALNAGSPELVAALGDFYDSLNPAQQQQVRDFLQRRGGWHRS